MLRTGRLVIQPQWSPVNELDLGNVGYFDREVLSLHRHFEKG